MDSRGQRYTDKYLSSNRSPNLKDISVAQTDFKLQILEPHTEPKPPISLPIVNQNRAVPYWVQRGHFVELCQQYLPSDVKQYNGFEVTGVVFDEDESAYIVTADGPIQSPLCLKAHLVVGADGINSKVRSAVFGEDSVKRQRSPAGGLRFKVSASELRRTSQ